MNYRALTNLTVFKKNMKKSLLALATVLGFAFNASAQGGPGEDNGLGLRLNVGIPMGNYGINQYVPFFGDMEYDYPVSGVSFGLTLDNRWYVWHNDKFGAAIQARWLDANFMTGELGVDIPFVENETLAELTNIEGGLLGAGPMFTWYLNDDMAIDAYYNFMPSVVYSMMKDPDAEDDDEGSESNMLGFGLAHHIGAAFRYKIFQAGLEYRIGKFEIEDVDLSSNKMDASMNSFRINLGFKF